MRRVAVLCGAWRCGAGAWRRCVARGGVMRRVAVLCGAWRRYAGAWRRYAGASRRAPTVAVL
ncbi:MAG: hypothetical protein IT323_03245 [Anaerolineae bacterium]|nr:hypothetical protein [Anaerolineae bacterium]